MINKHNWSTWKKHMSKPRFVIMILFGLSIGFIGFLEQAEFHVSHWERNVVVYPGHRYPHFVNPLTKDGHISVFITHGEWYITLEEIHRDGSISLPDFSIYGSSFELDIEANKTYLLYFQNDGAGVARTTLVVDLWRGLI